MNKKEQIILFAQLNSGLSISDVAVKASSSYGYAAEIIRTANIKIKDGHIMRFGDKTPQVIALRNEYPEYEMTQIASKAGLTRERVRQILKRAGLRTTRSNFGQSHRRCISCGNKTQSKGEYCQKCHIIFVTHQSIICSYCNRPFFRQIKAIQRAIRTSPHHGELRFCNKRCQGLWLAKNYGFGESKGSKTLTCVICGKEFTRKVSQIDTGKPYCSWYCFKRRYEQGKDSTE